MFGLLRRRFIQRELKDETPRVDHSVVSGHCKRCHTQRLVIFGHRHKIRCRLCDC